MRSRKIAIVGSIAALTFAATPVAAVAATAHHGTPTVRTDQSRDKRDVRHVDRPPDKRSLDRSADRSADKLDG
jgi:Ni/Co efflux regulator RcnB